MRWEDADRESGWWTIPAEVTKNKLSHHVPLPASALAILEALGPGPDPKGWVFPSPSADGPVRSNTKPAADVCKASKVAFTPHDLRRTAASYMASMGVSRFTVSKILNHVDNGVTAVYDRYAYDREKREAVEAWARRLETILAGKKADDGKVVALRPA